MVVVEDVLCLGSVIELKSGQWTAFVTTEVCPTDPCDGTPTAVVVDQKLPAHSLEGQPLGGKGLFAKNCLYQASVCAKARKGLAPEERGRALHAGHRKNIRDPELAQHSVNTKRLVIERKREREKEVQTGPRGEAGSSQHLRPHSSWLHSRSFDDKAWPLSPPRSKSHPRGSQFAAFLLLTR